MRDSTADGIGDRIEAEDRTLPLSACSRPRMCLMSVVLPAPFAPTRPYTPPRGIDRLTEFSAVFAPKRRVRSVDVDDRDRSPRVTVDQRPVDK